MVSDNKTNDSLDHFSERVSELKKVIERMQKHGPLLEKQRERLRDIVCDMEGVLSKQTSSDM